MAGQSLEEAYKYFFKRIVEDWNEYSRKGYNAALQTKGQKSPLELAALNEVYEICDRIEPYNGVDLIRQIFQKLRETSLPVTYTTVTYNKNTGKPERKRHASYENPNFQGVVWRLIDGRPENIKSPFPDLFEYEDISLEVPTPNNKVELEGWRQLLKLKEEPLDMKPWVQFINELVERVILNIEDLASVALKGSRSQRAQKRQMFSTGGQNFKQLQSTMQRIQNRLTEFFEKRDEESLDELCGQVPYLGMNYSRSYLQSILTGWSARNYHKSELLNNMEKINEKREQLKNAMSVLRGRNANAIRRSESIRSLTRDRVISQLPNASQVRPSKYNAAIERAKRKIQSKLNLYERARLGALDPSKLKRASRVEKGFKRRKAQLSVQAERVQRKLDERRVLADLRRGNAANAGVRSAARRVTTGVTGSARRAGSRLRAIATSGARETGSARERAPLVSNPLGASKRAAVRARAALGARAARKAVRSLNNNLSTKTGLDANFLASHLMNLAVSIALIASAAANKPFYTEQDALWVLGILLVLMVAIEHTRRTPDTQIRVPMMGLIAYSISLGMADNGGYSDRQIQIFAGLSGAILLLVTIIRVAFALVKTRWQRRSA